MEFFGCDFGIENSNFFGCDFGTCRFFFLVCGCDVDSNFFLQNLKSQGSLQMLKGIWEILSPDIKNIFNEADFQTFFQALLN